MLLMKLVGRRDPLLRVAVYFLWPLQRQVFAFLRTRLLSSSLSFSLSTVPFLLLICLPLFSSSHLFVSFSLFRLLIHSSSSSKVVAAETAATTSIINNRIIIITSIIATLLLILPINNKHSNKRNNNSRTITLPCPSHPTLRRRGTRPKGPPDRRRRRNT